MLKCKWRVERGGDESDGVIVWIIYCLLLEGRRRWDLFEYSPQLSSGLGARVL